MTVADAVRKTADGLTLNLRVQPGAARTAPAGVEVDGAGAPRLKLRIAAPPVDGKANQAVIAFLSKALGAPKRDCALTRGHKSRSKTIAINGAPDELLARVEALWGEGR